MKLFVGGVLLMLLVAVISAHSSHFDKEEHATGEELWKKEHHDGKPDPDGGRKAFAGHGDHHDGGWDDGHGDFKAGKEYHRCPYGKFDGHKYEHGHGHEHVHGYGGYGGYGGHGHGYDKHYRHFDHY